MLEFEMTYWRVYDESSVFSKAEEKVKLIHLEPELISFKSWKCGSGCPVPWGSECQTLKCLCPRDLLALADVTCSFHHVDYYKGHIFRKQNWKHKCWTKMWSVFLTLSSAIEMIDSDVYNFTTNGVKACHSKIKQHPVTRINCWIAWKFS